MKTLAVIGAHHDDVELNAGTIARHVKAGWRVVSIVATKGRYTAACVSDDNVAIREQESRDAAALLQIEPHFLDFPESIFYRSEDAARAISDVLRRVNADVVVTHPPLDYHPDHMEVSRTVLDAVMRHGYFAMANNEPPPTTHPRLYYCDAWFVPFQPERYIDVSEYIDLKKKALACHASQLRPGGPSEGDMIDREVIRARYRGFESGFKYAEAFRLVTQLDCVNEVALLEG